MMKKITLASVVIASLMSTSVFAATNYTPAINTSPDSVASAGETSQNFTYKGSVAGGFTVNDFTFSLSSFVVLGAAETTTSMAVGAASSRGTKVFTGSSNGGSVTTCAATSGADVSAATTDVKGKTTTAANEKNGCTDSTSS